MSLEGTVRAGIRTKELVKQLNSNDIAVIKHDDIDVLSAVSLVNSGVNTIINTGRSMTGKTEAQGARILLNNKIRLYDAILPFEIFNNNDSIVIAGNNIWLNGVIYKKCCRIVNYNYIRANSRMTATYRDKELRSFIRNTLEHAGSDLDAMLYYNNYPHIETCMKNRHVLIMVRNSCSMNEFGKLPDYIKRHRPVLVGVDGGADLLLNAGYTPDILIGDMDSVSDWGICKSREIVIHTYSDGFCPNIDRVKAVGKSYKTISLPGTSEDIALMLVYAKGAALITLAGGHSTMDDFLSKGRKGMGSTLITRLIVNDRLIDLKNYDKL